MAARVRLLAILAAGLLCAPAVGWAEQAGKVARIGYLGNTPGPLLEAFRQGLRDLGWIEGRNLLMEFRWAQGGWLSRFRSIREREPTGGAMAERLGRETPRSWRLSPHQLAKLPRRHR